MAELQKVIDQLFTAYHVKIITTVYSVGYSPISEVMQEVVVNVYIRCITIYWRAILQVNLELRHLRSQKTYGWQYMEINNKQEQQIDIISDFTDISSYSGSRPHYFSYRPV